VHHFVESVGPPQEAEARLLNLTPSGYVGLATVLVTVGRKEVTRA
jgi:hypothetical protein